MNPVLAGSFLEATPGQFFAVCIILAFLLTVAVGIKTLFQREPPLHREFVSREQCEKQHLAISAELGRHAASRKGIYEKIEEMDRHAAERTEMLRMEIKNDNRGIHERINQILEAVAEVRGRQA